MPALGEEAFRALLDEHGIVRAGMLAPPGRSSAYGVFAQRSDATLDLAALRSHASRFFATKLGFTVDKSYSTEPPRIDAVRIVLASADTAASGTRLCVARPVEPADLAAAEAAESAQKTHGMALLARRCSTIWLVGIEDPLPDRVALTLAAILASALLGPILAPTGDELFGVRTARSKLAG